MAYPTRSEIEALGILDPELAKLSEGMPEPPRTLEVLRALFDEMDVKSLEALGPAGPELEEEYREIPMRDGFMSRIKIVRPAKRPEGSPLFVLFYGGGNCIGSLEQMTAYAFSFARLFGACSVCPSYRRAPEQPFPIGLNDCWDTLKYVAANASSLGGKPEIGFIVGGVSAGGAAAAIVAHMAKDEKLKPALTGQWLSVPRLLTEEIVPERYKDLYIAREQMKGMRGFSSEAVEKYEEWYSADVHSGLFSPFNRSGFEGLPPAFVQVCGADPLRDDALVFEAELTRAGVATKMDVYKGMTHAWWALAYQGHTKTRTYKVDTVKGFAWLLRQDPQKIDEKIAESVMQVPQAG